MTTSPDVATDPPVTGPWSFASPVAEAFDDHARRSIPGYLETHALVAELAAHFIRTGTVIDVGTATGTVLATLAERHPDTPMLGVEVEPDMVTLAAGRLTPHPQIRVVQADATSYPYPPAGADLVVCHYTAHFIPPAARTRLLEALHGALRPGGALLLFDKTLAPTPRAQDIASQAYAGWKAARGFTADEITAKSRALRAVLSPWTEAEYGTALTAAGFVEVAPVWRHLAFVGLLAIRGNA